MIDQFAIIGISGGGSKGPYSCGVLLAIEKYFHEKSLNFKRFYVGTSVGALNATLAAQGDLNSLKNLYDTITTKDVIGEKNTNLSGMQLWRKSGKTPFSYFNNSHLKKLIEKYADFEKLKNSHLAICTTNYLTGNLETFYTSNLIDKFLAEESKIEREKRRLHNYRKINNQEELVNALLASASIPFFFPPVRIADQLYIDGGVGNNTPLRQLAYFSRFISTYNHGEVAFPVCILNDPERFVIDDKIHNTDMYSIINRAVDIFHNELVTDSMLAWNRINREVEEKQRKISQFVSYIEDLQRNAHISPTIAEQLTIKTGDIFGRTSAATERKNISMKFIRPSKKLVDNVLDFNPKNSPSLRRQGIQELFSVLLNSREITQEENRVWVQEVD